MMATGPRGCSLKRSRLLAGRDARRAPTGCSPSGPRASSDRAVAWTQFGPLAAYPRALVIRERYPDLPQSPAPWVVTCLQVDPAAGTADQRRDFGVALLDALGAELDRRGITAIEAYIERRHRPLGPLGRYRHRCTRRRDSSGRRATSTFRSIAAS